MIEIYNCHDIALKILNYVKRNYTTLLNQLDIYFIQNYLNSVATKAT